MEDSEIRHSFLVQHHSAPLDISEPARKKRCIRFSSDISTEDPSLVSDSGFGDLTSCQRYSGEHGDLEVSSFLGLDLNLVVDPEEEIQDERDEEDRNPDSGLTNLSSLSSDPSDPCCSSSFSPNSSNSNIEASVTPGVGELSSQSVDNSWGDIILQHKEIVGSPSKTHMMQRFLSHLKKNPNDTQLQHFFQLLLAGPEFSPPRQRLRHVTHLTDVIRLLRCSKKILVLTGAGISVSCGIPDFRSKGGLYARVSKVFPNLPDPQSVFDIRLFRRDPRPFFLTAKELYPGQFLPSLSHKFIQRLESRDQLLRNYSQNIDTLENIAGIQKVTMCHGSFATATCIRCKYKVEAEAIKDKVLLGEVPFCPSCSTAEEISQIKFPITPPQLQSSLSTPSELPRRPVFDEDDDENYAPPIGILTLPPVLKPDIVFFGEDLPDEFHNNLELDKPECDLLLVIGSSLRVRPVSSIPGMLPPEVPQILINRESLPHCRFDIELLGNCDEIIAQLCRNLGPGYSEFASSVELQEIDKLPRLDDVTTDKGIEPKSENDIQALKACWEPKVNESISGRLPEKCYLSWNPRQYVFQGAEILLEDEDEEDDDENEEDEDSSGSDSDASISSAEIRENETDVTRIAESTTRNPSSVTCELNEEEVDSHTMKQPTLENNDKSN